MKKLHLFCFLMLLPNYSLFGQSLKYPLSYKCDIFSLTTNHYNVSLKKMSQTVDTVSFSLANAIYQIDVFTEDSINLKGLFNGKDYTWPCKYSVDSANKLFLVNLLDNDSGLTDITCMEDSLSLFYCNYKLLGNNVQATGFRIANKVNIDSLIDTLVSINPEADSITIIQGHGVCKIQSVSINNIYRNKFKNNCQYKYVKMVNVNDARHLPVIDILGRNVFQVNGKHNLCSSLFIYKSNIIIR